MEHFVSGLGGKTRSESWIDSRVEARESPLGGFGIFAKAAIRAGEVVVVWGGIVLTAEEVEAGLARENTVAPIDEGVYLGSPADGPASLDDFMNHSCDPNLWMTDAVTLVARREIRPGEEMTADYAMWEGDEGWASPWACRCGSPLCRTRVTGRDWRRPDLQERYRDHFSPFLALIMVEIALPLWLAFERCSRSVQSDPSGGEADPEDCGDFGVLQSL